LQLGLGLLAKAITNAKGKSLQAQHDEGSCQRICDKETQKFAGANEIHTWPSRNSPGDAIRAVGTT
jgi:hypothetical protein